jgi:diguanylate cyclase (GGDEF)-like protein/PAS domain S-box-containing protein
LQQAAVCLTDRDLRFVSFHIHNGGGLTAGEILYESYDYRLVTLSVVFSVLAAHAAFDLAGRVKAARDWTRLVWLGAGAVAMGLGVWSMHYVGMLAFSLRIPVLYHYPTVVFSLIAAIAASAVALFTISREEMNAKTWVVGSVMMGGGIVAMHFIGMAAMRMSALTEYDRSTLALAVVWAIAGSLIALRLAFQVRHEEKTTMLRKLGSSLVMGGAIALMHYTAMWSAAFRESAGSPDYMNSMSISSLGIVGISGVTLTVLLGAIGTSFLDQFIRAQHHAIAAAREGETFFRTLARTIPEIVWTARSDGFIDFASERWYEYTGQTPQPDKEAAWKEVVHPDDFDVCNSTWQHCVGSGAPYEVEYRLRRGSDGDYRWFLARATPVRDAQGQILKWFGTCTDIEEQKHHQQILEQEIKTRTEELADSNTRLQEEMWAKDATRRQLDEQNEKMVGELTERSQRATLLAKMGELLQSCVTKDEVFAAALGFAPKIFPNSRGAVALLNAARSLAEIAGSWQECMIPATVFEPSSCWALRTSHPHLVVAGDTTAPCLHASGVNVTYLCLPIMAQGEALGILHFQATEQAPSLADAELSFRTTFAGQVGLSVANIRLREALRTQSTRDALTGLYNRRYLEEMLDREIRRAVRAGHPLGILMLDLDHFKTFNDTYGHDAGDTVLRETATFLTRSIRIEDFACRFGGEEFVIILPTADLQASQARAERIRSKIRELAVLHQGNSLGKITVSVGVAGLPVHGTSPKELLNAADAALYRAKREGRDRVVLAGPPVSEAMAAAAVSKT